jgi:hypothetical protein
MLLFIYSDIFKIENNTTRSYKEEMSCWNDDWLGSRKIRQSMKGKQEPPEPVQTMVFTPKPKYKPTAKEEREIIIKILSNLLIAIKSGSIEMAEEIYAELKPFCRLKVCDKYVKAAIQSGSVKMLHWVRNGYEREEGEEGEQL